jgi:hypothetical protein
MGQSYDDWVATRVFEDPNWKQNAQTSQQAKPDAKKPAPAPKPQSQ